MTLELYHLMHVWSAVESTEWPAGHLEKDRGNCIWSHLWLVTIFYDVTITTRCRQCVRSSACRRFPSAWPAHLDTSPGTWLGDYTPTLWGPWDGRGCWQKWHMHSLPVNGTILAITPGRASDHQILIEFHKPIINYEKIW